MYKAKIEPIKMKKISLISMKQAHQMLGHPGNDAVKRTSTKYGWKKNNYDYRCEDRAHAKTRQNDLNKENQNLVEKCSQIIYVDTCWIDALSIVGKTYWVIIVDEKLKMKWIFSLKININLLNVLYL